MIDRDKLVEQLKRIQPGLENSNSAAEDAMVELLPTVIAALTPQDNGLREALAKLARRIYDIAQPMEGRVPHGDLVNVGDQLLRLTLAGAGDG